ncbi:signal peptidase II [Pantoea sp. Mhis]|uniref:signal peptidase II n=1 Tax=Pantoea sp. Mhis TaxID=2576759 RepID=UPI001358E10F|nr:signal peptidase II [Pantoea sp. Mhis]MXP56471.1 lipoprotein signal peptidase [Pantoea sp. Mhis]
MFKTLWLTGLRWLWLVVIISICDMYSKYWIMHHMFLHETYHFIPFFNLLYLHNYGAIFSFLSDQNGWQRWFFISITLIIVIELLMMMYCNHASNKIANIAYALLIGGAIGNLLDRIRYGFVIDFIDFYICRWHFAIFNFADCTICIGTILLIIKKFNFRDESS